MSTHAVTLTRSWYRPTYFHHQSSSTGGEGTYHNKQCISITLGKVPSIRVFCTFESWHQREKKASPSPLKVIRVPLPVQSSPAPPLFSPSHPRIQAMGLPLNQPLWSQIQMMLFRESHGVQSCYGGKRDIALNPPMLHIHAHLFSMVSKTENEWMIKHLEVKLHIGIFWEQTLQCWPASSN